MIVLGEAAFGEHPNRYCLSELDNSGAVYRHFGAVPCRLKPAPGSSDDGTLSVREGDWRPGRMNQAREPVQFPLFSASLHAGSPNSRLARLAADAIAANGGEVNLAAMDDFDAPSYDPDVQEVQGFPAAAEELRDRVAASDAFVIASPEYDFSTPGSLKNSIDWCHDSARSRSTSDTGS